jgi:hypothetical protein
MQTRAYRCSEDAWQRGILTRNLAYRLLRTSVEFHVMNAFRHLLSRSGLARHALLMFVFSVLVSRGLLSGAVMIDPDPMTGGALVMCSGHGPVFDASMPGMDMSMLHHGDGHTRADKSGDLCAFSASLVTALACAAFLLLLFHPFPIRRTWSLPRIVIAARSVTYVRPPPRAPPRFS